MPPITTEDLYQAIGFKEVHLMQAAGQIIELQQRVRELQLELEAARLAHAAAPHGFDPPLGEFSTDH